MEEPDLENPKRRLVICLDGTWNDRDSSTNVNSLNNLIEENPDDGVEQISYYDPGVGTGVLDGITGGGFGIGLDKNVRQAYNWLIGNYREGDDIFIFGFSRGAYTARSLVGFISRCGLLLPGAPMTVKQLWEAYGLLGRRREKRGLKNVWELAAGEKQSPFRQITTLKNDFWDEDPHPTEDPKNLAEALLIDFSRRVPIEFLGIFDTVGAMGWEALAIPGLRSRLSQHHNMWVTSIIRHCYHALAIDENRSSFAHTPIHQYLGSNWTEAKAAEEMDEWKGRVRQRWFVGAHSNVGGGYPDNLLAKQALGWMLDGARDRKLQLKSPNPNGKPAQVSQRVDSYARFAAPLWTGILRAKRTYRRIDPPVEIRARYSRKYINEAVHPDALELAKQTLDDGDYCPPNLIEYARRRLEIPTDSGKPDPTLVALADSEPGSDWLETHEFAEDDAEGDRKKRTRARTARSGVVGWGVLGAVGLVAMNHLIRGTSFSAESSCYSFLALFAALLVLIDWAECRLNSARALFPDHGYSRAASDAIYWMRAVGVIFFGAGALYFAGGLFGTGWSAAYRIGANAGELCEAVWLILYPWWPAPVLAAGAVLCADVIDKKFNPRTFFPAALAALALLLAAGFIIALAGLWIGKSFWHLAGAPESNTVDPADGGKNFAPFAGSLLLLQVAFLFLAKGFSWVGRPMKSARLGSIVPLQFTLSPAKVRSRLDLWREKLSCNWHPKSERDERAGNRLREIVGESIHRDNVGLVPLYTLVLMFGMWTAHSQLDWTWLGCDCIGLPLWVWIGLITAAADYVENATHLHYLRKFTISGTPGRLRWLAGFSATIVKTLGFLAALLITAGAFIAASWRVIFDDQSMTWRGAVAGTVSIIAAIGAATLFLAFLRSLPDRIQQRRDTKKGQTSASA